MKLQMLELVSFNNHAFTHRKTQTLFAIYSHSAEIKTRLFSSLNNHINSCKINTLPLFLRVENSIMSSISSFKSKRKNLAKWLHTQLDLFDHSVIEARCNQVSNCASTRVENQEAQMNTQQNNRAIRGQEIANSRRVKREGVYWTVPSQSSKGLYKVDFNSNKCACPDFELKKNKCKHLFAVEYTIDREMLEAIDGQAQPIVETPKVKRPTYPQQWREYNLAQTNEKRQFLYLLDQLCKGIGEPSQESGRKRIALEDMLFACTFKVYSLFSGRRFISDLNEAKSKGYIEKTPHFNSIFNYFDSEVLTAYLQMLIEESAKPLAVIEGKFAVDSSGISTNRFVQWIHAKYSDPRLIEKREWVKIHLCCGVKTNVVTAVEVTDRFTGDSPMFKPLVEQTAQNFVMDEVSADKAYLSNDNLAIVARNYAMPFIPFKSDSNPYSQTASNLWTKMYHYFALNQEKFFKKYHLRSNVETTFHMIKSKFGDAIRSKTDRAQINEVLCKVLCHNICCLISAFYELGIKPKFWSEI